MPPHISCFIIADAAQESGGKLYVMGGGWDRVALAQFPGPLPAAALAMVFEIDWNDANQPIRIAIELVDADQRRVLPEPINFEFIVGRPPEVRPGTPIHIPIAVSLAPISFSAPGDYAFILRCEQDELARVRFTVIAKRP